jgi:hypothetical protein
MTADGFRIFNRKIDPITRNIQDKTGNKRILDPTRAFAKPRPKRKRTVQINNNNDENDQRLGSESNNTSF